MSRSWKKQGGTFRRMNLVKTNQLVATEDHHFHTYIVPTGGSDGAVTTGDTITLKEGANVYIVGDDKNKIITFYNIAARVPDISGAWYPAGYPDSTANFAIEASNNTSTVATGHYAVASGADTDASGLASFAHGWGSRAIGDYSVAMGLNCDASGIASFADGSGCIAGNDYSIALGYNATTQQSSATDVSMGELIFVIGAPPDGNIMEVDICGNLWLKRTGLVNQPSMWKVGVDDAGLEPSGALVADNHNTTGLKATNKYAIATGEGTLASGQSSFSGGYNTVASGKNSVAMGYRNEATGKSSFSMGKDCKSSAELSYSFGDTNIASGYASLASGQGSKASGEKAISLGWGAHASGLVSCSIGRRNTSDR